MKVLQLVTQMEAGGAQRVAMLLHEALQQHGHSSEVGFLYLKRPTYLQNSGVRVLLHQIPKPWDYLAIAARLWRILTIHKPEVLITHTHYANVLGQIIARFCGVRTRIAVQHNPLSTYPKLASWVDRWMGSTAFYTANVGVSQVVLDSAQHYPSPYTKLLQKIYNGIPSTDGSPADISSTNIPQGNSSLYQRLNIPPGSPLLINVGRLARQKNQATLLEALVHLPTAHLLLVGDGELRSPLQQQVATLGLQSRVHFLGELNSEQVLESLAACHLFVFPSLFEAMPMALIEAMTMGLPIVASDIPALREVLAQAATFVPAQDAQALAQTIQSLLNSPQRLAQMRSRSLERSRVFSTEKMVLAYETLFC
jgi:glycosyltransferase involved in cell wall biosynthesis